MSKLLVIADDFTGALDTGVQFAKNGIVSKVFLGKAEELPSINDNEVLIYNTNSRHMNAKDAYSVVRDATKVANSLGFTHVYKKTDSGLRGHIGGEIEGAMTGFGVESLHFFPAYPKVNRITRDGIHLIDGLEVKDSVFGKDPFNPVTKSDVGEILREETSLPLIYHKKGESCEGKGIHVHDAESDEDFILSSKKTKKEELKATSGCAGYAPVLSSFIGLKGTKREWKYRGKRAIVVSGSINPVTQKIMAYSDKIGIGREVLVGKAKADRSFFSKGEGDSLIKKAIDISQRDGVFIFDVGPKDEPGHETEIYRKENNMSLESLMESIADNLGELCKKIIENAEDTVLVCIGGDTLSSTIKALGIDTINPLWELYPGVVLTEVEYMGKTLSVITKSGGFGDENLLVRLKKEIMK